MSKILIIEDDAYLTEDLKYFIEEAGHTCCFYRYADEVIENLDNLDQYDFIILDIMMMRGTRIIDDNPDMETGEILFKKIREKYGKKIIVISAKDFKSMTIDFKKEHNVFIIEKALNEEKIKQLLYLLQ
jgi:DNA-binding response OmpR family regulator